MKTKISQTKERLLRNPKTAYFVLSIFCLFMGGVILLSPIRHHYDPKTRVVGSKSLMSDSMGVVVADEDLLPYNALCSDLIVEGEVIGVENPKEAVLPGGPAWSYVLYQVKVKDVWFGECTSNIISLGIPGSLESGPTKPFIGDELILFLYQNKEGNYGLIYYEASMFALNPPLNRLYAFSDKETLTDFDGKSKIELRSALENILDDFPLSATEDYSFIQYVPLGDIANDCLPDGHPRKEVYETE